MKRVWVERVIISTAKIRVIWLKLLVRIQELMVLSRLLVIVSVDDICK
ncbi:MAG: hypothetical protein ACXV4C_07075 [Halobacteriota archaeon]